MFIVMLFCDTWNGGIKVTTNLKLVTHTDRMPASAAALHATGTTSETCQHLVKWVEFSPVQYSEMFRNRR
jgi:hypothetical protein